MSDGPSDEQVRQAVELWRLSEKSHDYKPSQAGMNNNDAGHILCAYAEAKLAQEQPPATAGGELVVSEAERRCAMAMQECGLPTMDWYDDYVMHRAEIIARYTRVADSQGVLRDAAWWAKTAAVERAARVQADADNATSQHQLTEEKELSRGLDGNRIAAEAEIERLESALAAAQQRGKESKP